MSVKAQYYYLPIKRVNNISTDAERSMKLFADTIKTLTTKHDIKDWDASPLAIYMEGYLNSKAIRDLLLRVTLSPTEYITENFKDYGDKIIFSKEELSTLYTLTNALETTKVYLNKNYGFSTVMN